MVVRLVTRPELDENWFRGEVARHLEQSDLEGAILILPGEKLIVNQDSDVLHVLANLECAKASVVDELERQ